MLEYALVNPDGSIVGSVYFQDGEELPPSRDQLHSGKPYLLPIVVVEPTFDSVSQVVEASPTLTVGDTQVTRTWAVRDKTTDEIASMKADQVSAVAQQFGLRTYAPISLTNAASVTANFETDETARSRISKAIQLMDKGLMASPRYWDVYQSTSIVQMTTDDMWSLAVAIATREDGLFAKYNTILGNLTALSTAADIAAFDPTAGWD